MVGDRTVDDSANAPVTNAAAGNATRYPAVGPRNRKIPGAPPGAKNGSPTAPSIRYAITAIAPKREPSNAPVNNTAKLCPVIGIGPMWIENCADAAMNKLNTITNPAERTESSGASAAPINVSALAYVLMVFVSLYFVLCSLVKAPSTKL